MTNTQATNTHAIKTGKGSFLFVQLPKAISYGYDATKNVISCLIAWGGFDRSLGEYIHDEIVEIPLPEGEYVYLGATRSITEETAAGIVDDNGMGCWDNYRLKKDEKYTCLNASSSLKCLIISLLKVPLQTSCFEKKNFLVKVE